MSYRSAVNEVTFILDHIVPLAEIGATERFADATPETAQAILNEAARMCDGVIAPLNRGGDLAPARLENGIVRTSPGFAEALGQWGAGGWIGLSAGPEHGGMGLPQLLNMAVQDMMSGACLALQLNPAADPGPDRGAGGARLGRPESALPAETHLGRMVRHDEPDRAASGVRRRRPAHQGRAAW